jgi:hypothetical protein
MNPLAPPLEVIVSAATTVLVRVVCFLLTCSLGCGLGFVIGHWDEWRQGWYFQG